MGLAWLVIGPADPAMGASSLEVGLYRVFEASVENHRPYDNRFADVELRCTYTAPSGREIDFIGFFDGDGQGGGDAGSGHLWKMRFMPDELGEWRYRWSWSDGTEGGSGSFRAISEGAGKGVLRPYEGNPRWFAYNGTEPVWIKSYYETGHGSDEVATERTPDMPDERRVGTKGVPFAPPNRDTDWVLLLRASQP